MSTTAENVLGYILVGIFFFLIIAKSKDAIKRLLSWIGGRKKEEVEPESRISIVPDGFRRGQQEWQAT